MRSFELHFLLLRDEAFALRMGGLEGVELIGVRGLDFLLARRRVLDRGRSGELEFRRGGADDDFLRGGLGGRFRFCDGGRGLGALRFGGLLGGRGLLHFGNRGGSGDGEEEREPDFLVALLIEAGAGGDREIMREPVLEQTD